MTARRRNPADMLAKLVTRMRARGPGELVSLAAERLRETLHSERELVFFAVDTATVPRLEREDLTFRRAVEEDGASFAEEIGTDSPRTFAARLSEREECYLVLLSNRIVHSSWVTKDAAWTRELRAYVRPPAGGAYVYESFTAPAARGKSAYPYALSNIAADLVGDDVSYLWVAAEADNQPSLRAITKAGFAQRARVGYRRSLGKLAIHDLPSDEDFPQITANPA